MNIIEFSTTRSYVMSKKKKNKQPKDHIDHGTPELRAKRMLLVGGGDPAFAEHPMGILHQRGYLSNDHEQSYRMYSAGMEFGILWGRVFKPPFAQSMLAQFQPGDTGVSYEDDDHAKAEARFRSASAFLKERAVYDALVNAVVYRRVNPRTLDKLRTALCRLIQFNKGHARAA
jgi:hypothetical protein